MELSKTLLGAGAASVRWWQLNQALGYEFAGILPEVRATGVMISTCTIQQRSNTISLEGAVDLTDWVNVPGLIGITCIMSVHSPYRPNQSATIDQSSKWDTLAERHVFLNGWFPDTPISGQTTPTLLQQYQAVVDAMDALQDAQIQKVGLLVKSKSK